MDYREGPTLRTCSYWTIRGLSRCPSLSEMTWMTEQLQTQVGGVLTHDYLMRHWLHALNQQLEAGSTREGPVPTLQPTSTPTTYTHSDELCM